MKTCDPQVQPDPREMRDQLALLVRPGQLVPQVQLVPKDQPEQPVPLDRRVIPVSREMLVRKDQQDLRAQPVRLVRRAMRAQLVPLVRPGLRDPLAQLAPKDQPEQPAPRGRRVTKVSREMLGPKDQQERRVLPVRRVRQDLKELQGLKVRRDTRATKDLPDLTMFPGISTAEISKQALSLCTPLLEQFCTPILLGEAKVYTITGVLRRRQSAISEKWNRSQEALRSLVLCDSKEPLLPSMALKCRHMRSPSVLSLKR